ncbi:NAD(P)(+) transhydrogenase (Re/Si-specific) subunit beta, partial [Gemmatimonadota bacterium]
DTFGLLRGDTGAVAADSGKPTLEPVLAAARACLEAESVIIAPGYGMAMAQAQFEVVELARMLEAEGKSVRFAIHPVAGRMPGHMHVLLSEAEAPWDQLYELPDINSDFAHTDLVIVVGASDVVNPAASTLPDTPISGMPILHAHEAGEVLIVNLDDSPGYSGVRNLLYDLPDAILLWGDAKETLCTLLGALSSELDREPIPEVG